MMKATIKRAWLLILTLWAGIGFAQTQDTLTAKKQVPDSFEIHKVLIVPFNPMMYISDSDQELMKKSGLTFPKLVERFRSGLGVALTQKMPGWWQYELLNEQQDSTQETTRIYRCISYQYEPMDEKTMGAKKELLKKNEPKEQPKITKGQLSIEPDKGPKFMNIRFKSDTLLPFLQNKYKVDFVLFINQLDIQSDLSDYAANANKTYKRFAHVHYTMLDKEGKTHFAGLAKAAFPCTENDLQTIINTAFMEASGIVTGHLPPPVPVKKAKSAK